MRKLNPQDIQLLRHIMAVGKPVCPGRDANIPKAAQKALRMLAYRGDLMIEEYDDGPVFTITGQGRENAN